VKAGERPSMGYDSASLGHRRVLTPTKFTSQRPMRTFHYVYILESEKLSGHFYVGLTNDLSDRLRRHNGGEVLHTSKFRPWRIKSAHSFRDRDRAARFEVYLKSASGRAFAKKHL
jgi:putative endonuclease